MPVVVPRFFDQNFVGSNAMELRVHFHRCAVNWLPRSCRREQKLATCKTLGILVSAQAPDPLLPRYKVPYRYLTRQLCWRLPGQQNQFVRTSESLEPFSLSLFKATSLLAFEGL